MTAVPLDVLGGSEQSGPSGYLFVGAGVGGGVLIVVIFIVIILVCACWRRSQRVKQRYLNNYDTFEFSINMNLRGKEE